MRLKKKKLTGKEKKSLMANAIAECESLADKYIAEWKPTNPEWQTIEGAVYLRVSDPSQVLVDQGSFLQQVNMNIAEIKERSLQDKVNYRVIKVFIEPGVSGTIESRPSFQRMNWEIKNGIHHFIVFKEISRLVRDAIVWKKFFNLCIEKECEIFIKGLPFNPNDPAQVHQVDMLALSAEYESKQISKRTRETNHSAMIYSKKFNATHLVLGLDQLFDSEGNPVVGKYVSNEEELKTVEWIMRSFLKYGSYSTLLREIEKRKIVNKGEKPFTKGSLKTLLSNQKYIGKWEVNKKNQTKRQDKLMSYERYEKIDLPHGPVIEIDLWNQVQEKMIEVGHTNDKNDQHIHLLSSFLVFEEDESTFSGMHVRTKKKCYYSNKKHKFSLNAEVLENEARKILEEVISKTPKFQDALKITMKENEKKEDLMAYERIKIEKELEELNAERAKLDRRLDFLMDGVEDLETIKAFKIEYQTNVKVIAAKRAACSEALEEMSRNQKIFKKAALDIEGLLEKVKVALDYLEEHDRVALKNAYRAVFSKIVVGKKSDEGVRTLRFVLKSDGGFGKWTQKRIPVSPRGVGHVDKENVMKSGESLFTNSISENGVVNGNGSLDRVKMG